MSPLDAVFLDAEDADPRVSMAIASLAVIEGPPPHHDEVVARIAARLPLVPRYRQKPRRVPFNLGRPIWVDDPDFDVHFHVRRTALAAPGDDEMVVGLLGRVMSQRLDRDRPLWEYWVIEGLAGGRWALLTKVHHCMVDGVSGANLYYAIVDPLEEQEEPATDAVSPAAAPAPSALELTAQAAYDLVRDPAGALVRALAAPKQLAGAISGTVRGVANLADALRPATSSSLFGAIGQQRRYGIARASMADIKTVRQAFGGSVNDVLLAAITAGFRHLLQVRGEEPEPRAVRTLVPVSMRASGDEGTMNNQVSLMLPFLPVHVADPVERLRAVRAALEERKQGGEAQAGARLTTLAEDLPFLPVSLGVRLAARLPQRNITTVTTNVPGPPMQLTLLGRPIRELFPLVPIATTIRFGLAIMSYHDAIGFGVTADYDNASDVDLLARSIENGLGELVAAAEPRKKPARRRRAKQ